jgi:hydroxymethylpyrimidine/phosphomethylpyrimidine kinase
VINNRKQELLVTTNPPIKPVVLTIGGLDPSGGAGIIADIRTFVAFNCFPTAVLTSITFQNTTGVFGAVHQTAATVRAQVDPIIQDLEVSAVKTGMLPTAEVVAEVAHLVREKMLPNPVVDPVMVSTSGYDLIGEEAFRVMKTELLPLALVVTPNIPEAERFAGFSIADEVDMRRAGEAILALGARAVLVKGGHRGKGARTMESGEEAIDIMLDNAGNFVDLRAEFLQVGEVHGSGCTLSAAIAANLAKSLDLAEAVRRAKRYVTDAIRSASRLGHGSRPL